MADKPRTTAEKQQASADRQRKDQASLLRAFRAKNAAQAARHRRVQQAIHGVQMAGTPVSPATRADAEAYVDGTLSAEQLMARVRARHGAQ